jgi:hypothetical protein
MFGLLVRSRMNAGQDGFRDTSSKQKRDLAEAKAATGVSRIVDRLITPSADYLASSGISSARLSMTAGIRIKTLTSRILAQDLPQPGSTVERMVATCGVTNNVKPLPPQAVANGQALPCW